MLIFGLFIWLCWTLFITAVLIPVSEKIEMDAINKQIAEQERLAAMAEEYAKAEEEKKKSCYFWGYF